MQIASTMTGKNTTPDINQKSADAYSDSVQLSSSANIVELWQTVQDIRFS